MELKLYFSELDELLTAAFNRTIMELKQRENKYRRSGINLLIAPLWN